MAIFVQIPKEQKITFQREFNTINVVFAGFENDQKTYIKWSNIENDSDCLMIFL